MRRRERPQDERAANGVPVELAEGPRVYRWAQLAVLARLEESRTSASYVTKAERSDIVYDVMFSAWVAYRRARQYWLEAHGLTLRDAQKQGLIQSRRPYFDPPGTPRPRRIGLAAPHPEHWWVSTATGIVDPTVPHPSTASSRSRPKERADS